MSKSEQVQLECSTRSARGSRAMVALRTAGQIPAVMYGRGTPVMLAVDAKLFRHTFHDISENIIIDLKIGKKHHDAIIKDYQVNPINDHIMHLDFFEIERGKILKTHVPITLVGSAAGARAGGVLEQPIHELEIECLPKDLPHEIEIDVSGLEIGQSLHVAEIALPEEVTVISNAEQVVAHVTAPRLDVTTSEEQASEEQDASDTTEAE